MVLRNRSEDLVSFAYGAITRCGPTFQTVQLETGLVTSWKRRRTSQTVLQPRVHNAGRLACIRFRHDPRSLATTWGISVDVYSWGY